jgi:hypothetical protein
VGDSRVGFFLQYMEINSKSDTGDLRIGDIAQDSPLSPPPFPEAPEPVPGR